MAIDRQRLVTRHNPVVRKFDPYGPLSVGNGEFTFTADITGLQTFPAAYEEGIPLCTMAQWGWHTTPVNERRFSYRLEDLRMKPYRTNGRKVGYPTESKGQEEVYHWLRMNPHRFHLGRIGLDFDLADEGEAGIDDLTDLEQPLDMWRGMLTSRFRVAGKVVTTKTCCHPYQDILAFSVASELLPEKKLRIKLAFPYPSPAITGADWSKDERHSTEIISHEPDFIDLLRMVDETRYFVRIAFSRGARLERTGKNSFVLAGAGDGELEFICFFTPCPPRGIPPSFRETAAACERYWESFWNEGGVVELAESADDRAGELERRVVLSQYLTAIQCAGSLPPQETGLTCNSWYGKFHLEMHWWHAAHFPLWGRARLLEKSLWWYRSILPKAKELAASQGYRGARWPKMVACDGVNSPSPIAPLLIWQQPHPIYYAELCYRAHPDAETLEIYKDIVFATAAFMVSFVVYDRRADRYLLAPPLIPAQENHDPEITLNPAFELEYWVFGLHTANEWRKRLGLAPDPLWAEIAAKLGPLPVGDGVYLAHERCPDTFTAFNYDHPSMLGAYGVLPGRLVDPRIMANTLRRVLAAWQWERVWGWDFPMMAMTAARLGEPELAVTALLYEAPNNTYLPNGHNRQGTRPDLPVYLPGNGALLTAVGMMAAGWDGGAREAPGFPKDGRWKVRQEGLSP
ncbi:MAG: glycoside hydrolase family 65, partial [Firmicutes bacterium]|nr:glycoside hydrolase family 65 [Bacillota bacterium]